jgi:K+-sensing histidine kinase KdpD
MEMAWYRRHRGIVRVLAVVVPLVISGVLHLISELVANSAAALVLVLFVVGAASTGDRLAGLLAAMSAAVGFDFFLTRPYFGLQIDSAEDIELAVLLLLIGLAVSELASWAIRQNASATEKASFVAGALQSADLAAGSINEAEGLERVAGTIRELLGVDRVTFTRGVHDAAASVIQRDGSLRHQGKTLDVALTGLPRAAHACTVIPVVQRGSQVGYFAITTAGRDVRPSRDALRVAVLLASQWSTRATAGNREARAWAADPEAG